MQGDSPPPGCSSSGLLFQLHPVSDLQQLVPLDRAWTALALIHFALYVQLVLINISDHHTRTKANAGVAIRVAGCLLGQQIGRTIDISNSFEVVQTDGHLDEAFLAKKLGQCAPACTSLHRQATSCSQHNPPTMPPLQTSRPFLPWILLGGMQRAGPLAAATWPCTARQATRLPGCTVPWVEDQHYDGRVCPVSVQMMLLNEAPVFLQLNPSSPRGNSKELPVALYETGARGGHECTHTTSVGQCQAKGPCPTL